LVGKREDEVARRISARLIELGDGLAFDVIVASGPNAARPHHRPGDRIIAEREPIVIDMGGRSGGYCGDLTRTLWYGEWSDQFEAVYRAVLRAQVATKDAVFAGQMAQVAALAADTALQDAGFGEYILHSVGHGVGLDIHEAPWLRKGNETLLQTGSVVTVEPGLYIPGWGGVRVEDVVIVGDGPCETITTASKLMSI
ncbi:MAG TPA: M24 family metallopeptidase, partial [Thermomicrobiales bacterium]|nr:M24 family metallopeptidase [Thermomicrobiales bacterium]